MKTIAPAIIRLVISAWPMLSQASEVSLRTAALGEGADRLAVALRLALLGAEIFDRLVIEQRVDRAADRRLSTSFISRWSCARHSVTARVKAM